MIEDTARDQPAGISVVDHGLLVRYRVMAFTTAALLIIIVFVGIPIQVASGHPGVVNVVGTIHGFLYLVYLYVAFQLTRRLGVPKWKMALVLLAGTVPFCAFVAERKMTRRFETSALTPAGAAHARRRDRPARGPLRTYAISLRRRWLSRRAVLLHVEVAVVAGGCVAAGWWQATRALAGNEFSWVYSIEWPVFALVAVVGWWQLIHEDPEAYRARKQRPTGDEEAMTPEGGAAVPAAGSATASRRALEVPVNRTTARLATALVGLIGVDFLLGIGTLMSLPFNRPSGWLPAHGEALYVVHAVLGLVLGIGAVALLIRARGSSRNDQMIGWFGFVGVTLAGVGGVLTEFQSLVRFLGIAFMFIGPLIAGLGYLIPVVLRAQQKTSPVAGG